MDALTIANRLSDQVLRPLKATFVGKEEIIDLMGVALAGGENLFLHGPPGTAKSALVNELAKRLETRSFDYLLTRFTEPSELFGPFDIRKLREGDLVTNTEGMLPEADFIFLDELLNANSAILNSLLLVLNERIFRRGRETRKLPALMVVGASNHLPEEEGLRALFDRFLLRVHCGYVQEKELSAVIEAGWELEKNHRKPAAVCGLTALDIRLLQEFLPTVDLTEVRPAYLALISRLRVGGIEVSDRRAVKLQRVIAASALMCGRLTARVSDLWVLRYIWDREEQRELLSAMVQEALSKEIPESADHPQAFGAAAPDPEALARDLELMETNWDDSTLGVIKDQLSALAARIPWVPQAEARAALQEQIENLWRRAGA
ncbi:MAG: AAA family ATPase [Prosthecobacter sp.]|nr:AAA family ATPase [Prosthecobacter sp.]